MKTLTNIWKAIVGWFGESLKAIRHAWLRDDLDNINEAIEEHEMLLESPNRKDKYAIARQLRLLKRDADKIEKKLRNL